MKRINTNGRFAALMVTSALFGCSGTSTRDHHQEKASSEPAPATAPARTATATPPSAASGEVEAEVESPDSQDGLVVKVDGARVAVKRAFAYSDGPKTMVLMTNNAAMECGTYFEPGRGYGPDEKHVWLWLDSSGGAWKVWGVMVENRSTNGDGLGTVHSTQGTPNDEVHADLEVDARIPPPPQSKEPSIALEIDGKLIAVGCGKNPAAL